MANANAKEALVLLKKHFPDSQISEDEALLLANGVIVWGGLVEVRKAKFSNTLDQLENALKAALREAPYYAAKRFKKWDKELEEFRQAPKLFGKQNTSGFEIKVILTLNCRDTWLSKTKRHAPRTYRGDTHRFTKFVDDVILLHSQEFSARSAIEAYNYYFFKM